MGPSVVTDHLEPCDIAIGQLPCLIPRVCGMLCLPMHAVSGRCHRPRDWRFCGGEPRGLAERTAMMGAPRNHPVVRLSPHPCYDFTARFASPIALASIANDPCYPPILHADRPPATLHCGPARFLADLPSLLSTGASVIRQLLLAFYTCETRGRGPSCSPVSLKHTGGDNRAWSRAALLVPSGAPGALLRRYVACTSSSHLGSL
jgi:hypothetical protein